MQKGSLLRRVIEYITDAMAVISAVLLSIMALMICVAVILRYFFNFSVGWATEIEEYILYLAVILAAPWVLKHDKHVAVDVVINYLSPKAKRRVAVLTNSIGVLIGLVLLYYSSLTAYENYVNQVLLTKILPVPKYLPLMFIPLMSFFVSFQFWFKVWDNIYQVKDEVGDEVQGVIARDTFKSTT